VGLEVNPVLRPQIMLALFDVPPGDHGPPAVEIAHQLRAGRVRRTWLELCEMEADQLVKRVQHTPGGAHHWTLTRRGRAITEGDRVRDGS
jgi:hypothetical protein